MNKTKSEGDVVYEDTFFRIDDGTYTVNHYRMFEIKYLGATDTKGSRLKVVDTRHNQSKTLSKDYSFNLGRDQVFKYLDSLGIKIEGFSTTKEKDFIFTLNFDILLR